MTPGQHRGGLRIAMIGQKGLPATFGGIEHHVEELGSRMVVEYALFCNRIDGFFSKGALKKLPSMFR